MIEEALKELDEIISKLSEEANLLKQKLLQKKLLDNVIVIEHFNKIENLCSKIKMIKMTLMLQIDYIKDQMEL